MDPRADRTALRLRLYENGFTPLANKSKMCLIKGWSTLTVTPDLIRSREWARSASFLDTGIRCGEVVALDWDIDDADLLNDLLDEVVGRGLVEESDFVRIGKAPRELWVYRTSDKIGKRTTGHFAPPNADEEFKGYAVEILGTGCQFAAFGQRDETTRYSWPVTSLLDVNYMDLPVITHAQVDALKDFCSAFLENRGLVRLSPGGGTDKGYTLAYDLEDDMVFEVHDAGEMSVAELRDYLRVNPEDVLRCKVDVLRPTSGSWAGMISLVNGDVCVSDHGTYTSHFPAALDIRKSVSSFAELLAERLGAPALAAEPNPFPTERSLAELPDLDPRRTMDENLAIALQRFVYINGESTVYDPFSPNAPVPTQNFAIAMRQYYHEEEGPRGGRKMTWLSDLWLQHPDRLNADGISMRPDQPWPMFTDKGVTGINTYRPQQHPAIGGDAALGLKFLEGLIPDESERTYFLRWLSFKLRNPVVRGPAIVMVAHDTYGTGRGTLVEIIRAMFGSALVNTVDFSTLSGKTYQSQYNDWLTDNLIVAVNEAQEATPNLSRWAVRSNAYEHLKGIVDPAGHHVHVVRKGQANTQGLTYASILVMTNHSDSLVIPPNDRRFAVLTNGSPPSPEFWRALHEWRTHPENIGALVRAILDVDMADYSPYEAPPMTEGKREMVAAGESELDRAMAAVLAQLNGAIIVKEQLTLRIEDWLADNNVEPPEDWHRSMDRLFARKTRRVPGTERLKVDGRYRVIRMVGRAKADDLKSAEAMLEAIERNGPLTRQVMHSGKVVAFPSR